MQEHRSKSKGKGRVPNTSHINQRSLSNHSNNSNGIKQQNKSQSKTVPHVYLNANELTQQKLQERINSGSRRQSRNNIGVEGPSNTTPDPRLRDDALN